MSFATGILVGIVCTTISKKSIVFLELGGCSAGVSLVLRPGFFHKSVSHFDPCIVLK